MGAWSASAARRAGETLERPPQTAGEPTSRLIEAEANRLVATYADTILRVSYTYLHNTQDAEDICQEVLLKALGRTKGFDSAEHERAWIIRVAINAAKDLLKRQTGRDTVALDEISEPAAPRRATEHELEARAEGVLERVMALPLEYPRGDLPPLLRRVFHQADRRHRPRIRIGRGNATQPRPGQTSHRPGRSST